MTLVVPVGSQSTFLLKRTFGASRSRIGVDAAVCALVFWIVVARFWVIASRSDLTSGAGLAYADTTSDKGG